MGYRERLVSRSILDAIFKGSALPKSLLGRIFAFFTLFRTALARFRPDVFDYLRKEVWALDEAEYISSFRNERKAGGGLKSIGDLGYSGSTFFATPNSKFLIKSLPRRFENTFFSDDMLEPYATHMTSNPSSLLVRITDFLYSPQTTIGIILGAVSSHHVVMENVLYGQSSDRLSDKWETYDLKPVDYFYPERDIAGGSLTSESTKERLIDNFEDKIRLTSDQRDELLALLEADTMLLESCNTVDYSLFVIRYPSPASSNDDREIPSLQSKTSEWRTGMTSSDKKWVYRCVILDFFWAKHKLQAMAMTGLVSSFNFLAGHGPMSITTTPDEYRRRFMGMVQSIISVSESATAEQA